ncbi:MAG: hypothetical protein U7123_25580, partial [Potamolinea sp.]
MDLELTPTIVIDNEKQDETSLDAPQSTNGHHPTATRSTWTIEQSEKLYRIQGWGEPYFSINS